MEFQQATPEQSKELSEYLYPIWHEVFDDMIYGGAETAEYIFRTWTNPDAIRKSIVEDGYVYGYMMVDGKRVGLYSYHIQDDGRFYINKVYLESSNRGKGYGNAALKLMFDIARKAGCHEAYLNVYYANERAIRAYERAGMEVRYRCIQMIGEGHTRNDYIVGMKL